MRRIAFWTIGGAGIAIVCGLAGLPHLSASMVTLTAFCAVPALIVVSLKRSRRRPKVLEGE